MHFLSPVKMSIRIRSISAGQMNKALGYDLFVVSNPTSERFLPFFRGKVGSLMLLMFIAIPFTFHNGEHLHRLGSPFVPLPVV